MALGYFVIRKVNISTKICNNVPIVSLALVCAREYDVHVVLTVCVHVLCV